MFLFKTQKKQIVFLFSVPVIFLLIFLFWQAEYSETIGPYLPEKNETDEVLYIINSGKGNIHQYQIKIIDNSTVFSLLEELSERENFKIEASFYPGSGFFIESIDGFSGGTDNNWWQYWVNGKLGEKAADKKEVRGGDIVEWRFDKISF